MKLHHFVAPLVSEDATRIQGIGKALHAPKVAKPEPSAPSLMKVVEAAKPAPKKEPVKAGTDSKQAMRDYAVDQLDGIDHGHLHVAHRKMKCYD